jgi:hypothetical protein
MVSDKIRRLHERFEHTISPQCIENIRKLKIDNPNASHRELAMIAFEGEYAVGVALKGIDIKEVH